MEQNKGNRINPYKRFLCAQLPNWLLRRTEISNGAKLCYARLCQYNGSNNQCFPKCRTLAAELGCSPRQVSRFLAELKKHGLIESIRIGKRCSNRYVFLEHDWIKKTDYMPTE